MKKILPLLLISSAAYAGSPLEGKWGDRQASLEFIAGGTLVATSNNESIAGKWEELPGHRFIITGQGFAGRNLICGFAVSGRSLKITDCPFAIDSMARLN
jgi:hypothetical protein